jgi:hypothetical protein
MSDKRTKLKKTGGAFNRGSTLSFYISLADLEHIPLLDFEKENFYSRSNIDTLAKRKIVSLIRWRNNYYIAVCPEYADVPLSKLLEIVC